MENQAPPAITLDAARAREIQPVRVKDLPAFLAAIEPVAREAIDGDMFAALAKNASKLIEATAIGAGVPRKELDEAGIDVLVVLATRVIEANADFFARSVLPEVAAAAERIEAAFASLSTTGSSRSSTPASTTEA